MRLIDADATIKEIKARNPDDVSYEDAWAITCIEHAPTIKPERRTGRWLRIEGEQEYVCQECGQRCLETIMLLPKWYYCPSCGAYMGGEQDGKSVQRI